MELSVGKLGIILDYLKRGGKVKMEGRTYVWLNNQVVNETETATYYIDGLAIEGRSYGPGEDWEDPTAGKPHYIGGRDITLNYFIHLTNNIEQEEFVRVCQDLYRLRQEENNSRF